MQNLKLELEKQLKVQMTLHTETSTITNNDHVCSFLLIIRLKFEKYILVFYGIFDI